jgi:hypothetical protein
VLLLLELLLLYLGVLLLLLSELLLLFLRVLLQLLGLAAPLVCVLSRMAETWGQQFRHRHAHAALAAKKCETWGSRFFTGMHTQLWLQRNVRPGGSNSHRHAHTATKKCET